jgi:hypothetical protein
LKTIIAGCRNVCDPFFVKDAIRLSGFEITEVVSGACRGVDRMGELWAQENGIPVHQFPPDWDKFGRSAGPIRNTAMAEYADALIALWDNKSKGTKNMIDTARRLGLSVSVYYV